MSANKPHRSHFILFCLLVIGLIFTIGSNYFTPINNFLFRAILSNNVLAQKGQQVKILSFSPTSGKEGTIVTITGEELDTVKEVTFGGVAGNFSPSGDKKTLRAEVPAKAQTGPITVSGGAGSDTSTDVFIVEDPNNDQKPVIDKLDPSSGPVGTTVVISGRGFINVLSVSFNGVPSNDFAAKDEQTVVAVVPEKATSGPVTVVANKVEVTSPSPFEVTRTVDPPLINDFSPKSGMVKETVTISGRNFLDVTGVSFNGTSAPFTTFSDSVISAQVPAGATSGPIRVDTKTGSDTTKDSFTVVLPVRDIIIKEVTPNSGIVGTAVTVRGSGFSQVDQINFNGTSAPLKIVSDNQIDTQVPNGATTGPLTISGGKQSDSASFTVIDNTPKLPKITGFTPTTGIVGTPVTISGSNLLNAKSVLFNGTSASINGTSDTSIQTSVPPGATSGAITVITDRGMAVSTGSFEVTKPQESLKITGFSPNSAPAGAAVSIMGSGFSRAIGVFFNGTSVLDFSIVDDKTINTTVPKGAQTGPIMVMSKGENATSDNNFTVIDNSEKLFISSFSPDRGAVGTIVTLNGQGFTGANFVAFNGVMALFNVISDNTIEVQVPMGANTGAITVSTPLGTTSTTDNFTILNGNIQFSSSQYTVNENDGMATITVTRTSENLARATVAYATEDGTAKSGVNYIQVTGVLIFESGKDQQSFTIPLMDNNLSTGDLTVKLSLFSPTDGSNLGAPSDAVLTIKDNETVSGAVLQLDQSLDFGAVTLGNTKTLTVNVRNGGTSTLSLSQPTLIDGNSNEFSIISSLPFLSLEPGLSTSFSIAFAPKALSITGTKGTVQLSSNAGSQSISLVARGIETTAPTVKLINPVGGETVISGKPFTIKYSGSDNDAIATYILSYSVDGGISENREIGRVDGTTTEVIWNVPDNLVTQTALVKVIAIDRSGNTSSTVSNPFTINNQTPNTGSLRVILNFNPPPPGVFAPPDMLKVVTAEVVNSSIAPAFGPVVSNISSFDNNGAINVVGPKIDTTAIFGTLLGYNVYRIPSPIDQSSPDPSLVVKPENLVGSLPADTTTFSDMISTSISTNYTYSVTAFFGGMGSSMGSTTSGTEVPVIKDVQFRMGTVFVPAQGSFIQDGAVLIVNDNDAFKLQFSDSGVEMTVLKKMKGSSSNLTLKKLIKKGATVKLYIKNPNDRISPLYMFTRTK